MQYYRCKCGKAESWTSMGVRQCSGCKECNTTLAQHPDDHKSPVPPHEYETFPLPDADQPGTTETRCKYCFRLKKELER